MDDLAIALAATGQALLETRDSKAGGLAFMRTMQAALERAGIADYYRLYAVTGPDGASAVWIKTAVRPGEWWAADRLGV